MYDASDPFYMVMQKYNMKRGNTMIKAGIIGATGYAGAELVRILMNHKEVEIAWYGSRSYVDENYADIYGNMFQIVDAKCMDDNMEELAESVDVIFTATPQGFLAGVLTEDILSKVKIVDLSADFRIKDVATYEKWYKIEHKSPQFIDEAVYGLCEINRDKVTKETRLVANPGCYTTCSILTAYPLVKEGLIDTDTLIVDAKSGTSGAGRGAKTPNLFCEVNESMKAYGVASHRHTPEIEEQLGYAAGKEILINFTPHLVPMNRGILATEYATLKKKPDGTLHTYDEIKAVYDKYYANEKFVRVLKKGVCPEIEEQLGYAAGKEILINFTPHLVPMNRGILATEYATLKKKPDGTLHTYDEIKAVYDKYYANEKFVRVLKKGVCPETKWVEGSNYVDVNFVIDERTGRIIMMGALDNLVKGAAGQAVQNMNLLFGFDEAEGLNMVPMFP